MLEPHVQLVLTDRTSMTQNMQGGVVSPHIWRFADLSTRLEFLLAGFGWCNMPWHLVETHIEAGRLARLAIAYSAPVELPIYVAHERARTLGTAGRWLVGDLRERLKTCPEAVQRRNSLATADAGMVA